MVKSKSDIYKASALILFTLLCIQTLVFSYLVTYHSQTMQDCKIEIIKETPMLNKFYCLGNIFSQEKESVKEVCSIYK
jgi:hypothetical protein